MKRNIKKIKESAKSRSWSIARWTLSSGLSMTWNKLLSSVELEEQKSKRWENFLQNSAQKLCSELSELKGAMMKGGQMLAIYGEHFLPKETTHILKALYQDSSPLEWASMEEILSLDDKVDFTQISIEKEAIACASLGQVHKGIIKKSLQEVAIKIQYPGVHQAIESDLRSLKKILKTLNLLPIGPQTELIFEEIKTMLQQETDYRQEAQATSEYKDLIEKDMLLKKSFIVPKVLTEFSTDKILTTTYHPGISPDDPSIEKLSQSIRDSLSEKFLYLYFTEIFKWGRLQTDPHLGNYKIIEPLDDPKILLLDFGATRKFPKEFIEIFKNLTIAALKEDRSKIEESMYAMKLLPENPPKDFLNSMMDLSILLLAPFKNKNISEPFDWTQKELPQQVVQISYDIKRKYPANTSIPGEIIFLNRKMLGVYTFLSILQSQYNPRKLMEEFLEL